MQNLEKIAFGRAKVSNLFGGAVAVLGSISPPAMTRELNVTPISHLQKLNLE
jgi:hypothetical protein